jgi:2-keto-4-pentenoate hydratase/2-oxohepta-3-ene-1,7-dioic acid hydratase in catechol pathway
MRLVTYRGEDGAPRSGVIVGDEGDERVIDLVEGSGGRLPDGDLLALLQGGTAALDVAREVAAGSSSGIPLASLTLLAPIARPGKLIAVAGNFQAHIEEGGGQRVDKAKIVPKLFIKPSSSIIAPNEPVRLPSVSDALDWELELAIVIGTGGRDIPVERARDHIVGYAVINDISARRMQWGVPGREPSGFDDFFDWLNGKWGDGFAPWGPWITTSDAVDPDPNELEMTLKVNDKVWQHGSTADMIFSPEEIISFASRFMTLEPGDVIAGGTLDGTGDAAGVYLAAGDVMHGTIGRLGTLTTPVVAADGRS